MNFEVRRWYQVSVFSDAPFYHRNLVYTGAHHVNQKGALINAKAVVDRFLPFDTGVSDGE